MRQLAFIFFVFAALVTAAAGPTNYFCVICGKGPLTGRIWLSPWGAICDDCYKLENHCSICGLPIRDGDGAVQTGDGRFICKFDKPNAVLDADAAREIFSDTRRELVELFGSSFALQFPDVTVNIFDVDYWSEKGRSDGLHKFGFSHTRKTAGGQFTHEVVLLSGRLRDEIAATAAHEYTHLWINENLPADRQLAADTVEGICELAAYKLMESRSLPAQQRRILDNPYTHGEITNLVAVEKENGMGYILNWVKNGATATLDEAASAAPVKLPAVMWTNVPPPLPEKLKFSGLLIIGTNFQALVNGVPFAAGQTKSIPLRNKTVRVHCREVGRADVVLAVDDLPEPLTLKIGEEKSP
jgi:hypothetical protein